MLKLDELKKMRMQFKMDGFVEKASAFEQVISKIQQKYKDPTEDEIIQVIKKIIDELKEERSGYIQRNLDVTSIDNQINFLSEFLPKQLSEKEIKNIIDTLEDKSIPSVMKYFKLTYGNSVDMKLVSQVIKGN